MGQQKVALRYCKSYLAEKRQKEEKLLSLAPVGIWLIPARDRSVMCDVFASPFAAFVFAAFLLPTFIDILSVRIRDTNQQIVQMIPIATNPDGRIC